MDVLVEGASVKTIVFGGTNKTLILMKQKQTEYLLSMANARFALLKYKGKINFPHSNFYWGKEKKMTFTGDGIDVSKKMLVKINLVDHGNSKR